MKLFYYCLISGVVLGLASVAPAQAQDAATAGQGTYGQLAALSDQIAILKAQAQIAELQKQIVTAKRDAGLAAAAQGGAGAYPPGMTPVPMPSSPGNGEPHILSIIGRGWHLSAFLMMPDGAQVQAVPGTTLANGATVQSISPDSVKVIQNGRLFALPFIGADTNGASFPPRG